MLASYPYLPADYRAEFVSANSQEYCFTMGGIDTDISDTAIVEQPTNQCFPASRLAAPIEGVVGETAASFCFDSLPNDPENGSTCFASSDTNPEFFTTERAFTGANWGAVSANMTTLMIFRFDRNEMWRLWATIIMIGVLAVLSLFVYRDSFENKPNPSMAHLFWLATPILIYLFLRGVEPIPFEVDGAGSVVSGIWDETFKWESPLQALTDAGQVTVVEGQALLRGNDGTLSPISGWDSFTAALSANRSLLGVVGLIIFGGLTWLFNRRFPQQERESEGIRFGRAILRIFFIISAILAFLAGLQIIEYAHWLI